VEDRRDSGEEELTGTAAASRYSRIAASDEEKRANAIAEPSPMGRSVLGRIPCT